MIPRRPRRVVFRVDAARWIGSGHVVRCATLASVLRQAGAEIHFICREFPGHYCDWLENAGFAVHRLAAVDAPLDYSSSTQPPHASWLGVPLVREITECIALLQLITPIDWLIVDHYGLDACWESAMAPLAAGLLTIDDLADRAHACKILIDQNLQPQTDRYRRLLPTGSRALTGPRFALLGPRFRELRERELGHDGQIQRLLIFFGGTDLENITGRFLTALNPEKLPELMRIDVVIGSGNPHHQEITAASTNHSKITLHVQSSRMAELMATADLMIGTPGTTTWERCCLALPAILLSVAANQEDNGRLIARQRASFYLGPANQNNIVRATELLTRLLKHPRLLTRMSNRSRRLVDGKGSLRVVVAMLANDLQLRPATEEDCSMLWTWRNDLRTRITAFDTAEIPFPQHQQWFHKVLANDQQRLLIGLVAGQPIGVLRYDRNNSEWEISVYLDPDLHGLGLGSSLISAGSRWLTSHSPSFDRIVARIRQENLLSRNAFRKAGYASIGDTFHWHPTENGPPIQETS